MHKLIGLFALLSVTGLPASAQDYSDYPVTAWEGAAILPNFKGAQKEFGHFRTRLGDAAKRDADFAGSWVVEQIGCGGGCTTTYLIDKQTGNILRLPIGGEEQMYVAVEHKVSSSLIKANWVENGWGPDGDCIQGKWTVTDFEVIAVGEPQAVDISSCGF